MKKFAILIPVYNDWESLTKLLNEINSVTNDIQNVEFKCIIVNDASTQLMPKIHVPSNITSIKVINMKKNKGHARCNAFGIRYLAKKNDYDHVILMDGDGEDRPQEIKLLVNKALVDKNLSIVAKRIKRSDGPFFQFLYRAHKVITIIFTGKNINFGNYSCLTKKDILTLSKKESLWSSFSGSVKKYILEFNSINSIRGVRYFGPSKMSFYKLGIHSFSIIAVFKRNVFLRSTIFLFILAYLSVEIGILAAIFQFFLVIFNLLIFLVSLRENENEFVKSESNIKEELNFTR